MDRGAGTAVHGIARGVSHDLVIKPPQVRRFKEKLLYLSSQNHSKVNKYMFSITVLVPLPLWMLLSPGEMEGCFACIAMVLRDHVLSRISVFSLGEKPKLIEEFEVER